MSSTATIVSLDTKPTAGATVTLEGSTAVL